MALFFHSTYVQHDTGEFAGWMRDAIFRKLIRPNGIPFHRWEARLHDIIEIRDFIVASIILRHMPFDHATLQQFIHARHDNKPYSNALCCPSPIIYIQLEHYSRFDTNNTCAITWHRTQVNISIFVYEGLQIKWISFHVSFHVVAGIVYLGDDPNSRHCRIALFHSG